MSLQKSKKFVSWFLLTWIIGRGLLGVVLLFLDWNETVEPAKELLRMVFQMLWAEMLPIVSLSRIRKFLLNLLEGNLFTEHVSRLSKEIFKVSALMMICSLLDDIFISYVPFTSLDTFALNYVFPYLDNVILLLVFACLAVIVKNGTVLKEEKKWMVLFNG
ncbi:hypothetical protein K6V78_01535 [Streptococcus gallolyticus]|uniref:hypothetical protein n=1 Tax=Streptococcus hepaticus TaxID=3349163 RepID=UPI001C962FA4|nr:hypothetical protein [Streptococcus gallolyticus]MBY5040067.1 hypothetical protein [Streptococcus gallolyticus]